MGLDMYLTKEYYVRNWDHNPPEDKWEFSITQGGKPSNIPVNKISYIVTEECYWRKANAIHKWFVDNVQEGVDECQKSYVGIEDLKELLSLVKDILDNKEKAKELLPTQSGFFFGGTDYDKYYFEDLEYTKKELTRIIREDKKCPGEFYYHSSW